MSLPIDPSKEKAIRDALAAGETQKKIARRLGVGHNTVSRVKSRPIKNSETPPDIGTQIDLILGDKTGTLTVRSLDIHTPEQAIAYSRIDTKIWEDYWQRIKTWETTLGDRGSGGRGPMTVTNYQVEVRFRRKAPELLALETILERVEAARPVIPRIKRVKIPKTKPRRMLEVSLVDLHLGCRAFPPAADTTWSIEQAKQMAIEMQERLLEKAKQYGPYEYILYPVGNDLFHADNVFHTTTQGTGQPEAESWHHVFVEGMGLLTQMIDRLAETAPVRIKVIPGNHARQTEFAAGLILNAYYHKDRNVEVDASSSPYKFEHFGVNMLGFAHGHSEKVAHLAALMANETRTSGWAEARYCEWHLADKHRQGIFEEQGVTLRWLPALTPPNEWHRIKTFNWQKRAGNAFVFDYETGLEAWLPVNVDSYTGMIMGARSEAR